MSERLPWMCEHTEGDRQKCTARGRFRVRRAARRIDAQLSCGRHLAATVESLEEGDGSQVVVTIRDKGDE